MLTITATELKKNLGKYMIPCLITNNIADYQKSWPIMVMTPEQFLQLNQ